jgi:hypothetical protein
MAAENREIVPQVKPVTKNRCRVQLCPEQSATNRQGDPPNSLACPCSIENAVAPTGHIFETPSNLRPTRGGHRCTLSRPNVILIHPALES